ncbi:hypothetical protein NQ315_001718 [Exocentrus adspersus]|uniref:Uncharacterized protein n=1 Tax=Exocentrus adspersus TaxID=1586481 RepID=A0AAV8W9G2_9CUCU|nr:hypothetical protein NQ315_001718 [Exocentrus adspersus]
MHYYPSTGFPSAGYTHCRSGSDSGLHRRGSHRDVVDAFDSGDSTLSDLEVTVLFILRTYFEYPPYGSPDSLKFYWVYLTQLVLPDCDP